jgi:hypothetical protein
MEAEELKFEKYLPFIFFPVILLMAIIVFLVAIIH